MKKVVISIYDEVMKITTEGGYAHTVGTIDNASWELCSEEIARNDYENRGVVDGQLKNGGVYFPSENFVMPFGCGVAKIIDDVEVPDIVKPMEYKYIDGEFVINAPVRRRNIYSELEALDTTINRATEDLYKATGTIPHEAIAKIMQEKEQLRAELKELGE